MKIFLEVLLILALVHLRRTEEDYYLERDLSLFLSNGEKPAEAEGFPELHFEDYQDVKKGSSVIRSINKSCPCGRSNGGNHTKKHGAEVVPPYKYPWMVALRKANEQHVLCGGALISDRFVLTAAHCLERNSEHASKKKAKHLNLWNIREITVAFVTKTARLQSGPPVEKLIPHPKFNFKNVNHDIGLVKLSRRVPCGKFTRPICLAPVGIPVTIGKQFTIAGWGVEDPGDKKGSSQLLEAQILHVPFSMCKDKFHWKLKENYYCLRGLKGQSPCQGDSGGPMFKEYKGTYYALGVASMHSSPKCNPNDAFVFTSISRHVMWISRIIAKSSRSRFRDSSTSFMKGREFSRRRC